VTGQDERMDLYLEALTSELATLSEPQRVDTLFLGGGTPSYLPPELLERLLVALDRWLPCAADGEFTIEANPESLDAEKVALLADHGINRVSLGAQSFHPETLNVLERQHNPAEVARAVERVRQRLPRVSLDLIFGVPNQTLTAWDRDL